jgi:hypothetical protein
MARFFVRMRRQQVEEVSLSADVLWKRLRTLGQRLLLEGEGHWFEARPLDVWQALARTRPDGNDLEWLGELGAHGLSVDRAALDKARNSLPPDAFQTIRALRDLGLLREREPQMYALRPRWVLEGLLEQAVRETIDQEMPGAWGKILLRQEWAALAMQHVLDRCRQGHFGFIEKLIAAPETLSPAWVAALEASFRMLGLARLEGIEVPEALHRGVLRLQRRLLVPSYDGAPQPRLPYAHPLQEEHFLLRDDVWYTALLVLTEALPPQDELSLESWCKGLPAQSVKWMVGMVSASSRRIIDDLAQPWRMPLLLLGSRLFDRLALPLQDGAPPPDVLRPELLLRVLQQENPSLEDIDHRLPARLAKHLPEYARLRGVEWKPLARKVWTIWLATAPASLPNFLRPQDGDVSIFWDDLPPEAVRLLIQRNLRWVLQQETIYPFFQLEHWDVFVEEWASLKESWWGDAPSAAWQFIPPGHVRKALRAGLPDKWDHDTRRALWKRMPEVLCEELDALFKQGRWEDALTQAWQVPPAFFEQVLASAEMAAAQAEPPPSILSRWLRDEIRMRVPGWERAWRLLERLVPTVSPTSA